MRELKKMRLPKVLVFTPTYDGKEYCRKEFVENVMKFTYPNFEFLMIDNSKKGNYYHKLSKNGVPVVKVPRGNSSREGLAAAQNYARKKALDEGFDYVLSLESDIFPPKDIIQRLLKNWKPVVGALYYIGGVGKSPKRPCVFVVKNDGSNGTRLINSEEHSKLLGVGGLHRIHGMGVGCTLIDVSVLKNRVFWTDERFSNKHSDVYFYMDLWNSKVPVFVDYDIDVRHENSDWNLVQDR